jgi:hypothetical protein
VNRGSERANASGRRPGERIEGRAERRPADPLQRGKHVIAKGNAPDWAKLLDVNMLALLTGRERTRERTLGLSADD